MLLALAFLLITRHTDPGVIPKGKENVKLAPHELPTKFVYKNEA
jgi:hypothetical protein